MKIAHWMILAVCIGMMGFGLGCSNADGDTEMDTGDTDSDTDTDTNTGDTATDTQDTDPDTDTDTNILDTATDTQDTDPDTDTDTNTLDTATDTQDTDPDTDTDTNTLDTATDTDTGIASEMLDCDGGRLDPLTNLCWQNPTSGDRMTWSEAISYCDDLVHGGYSDWRLPNIDELISLLRGCQDGTATGDMSPSLCTMTPAGCAATDSCSNRTSCSSCSDPSGPGVSGCYWDPALSGTCSTYWSSSSNPNNTSYAWYVFFETFGHSVTNPKTFTSHARCVRSGP